jgi:hypothetical protein
MPSHTPTHRKRKKEVSKQFTDGNGNIVSGSSPKKKRKKK